RSRSLARLLEPVLAAKPPDLLADQPFGDLGNQLVRDLADDPLDRIPDLVGVVPGQHRLDGLARMAVERVVAWGRQRQHDADRFEQRVGALRVELECAIHRDARGRSLPAAQEEEHRQLVEAGRALEGAHDVDPGDPDPGQLRIDQDHPHVVVADRAEDAEARGDGDDVPAGPAQRRLEQRSARRRPIGDEDARRARAHVRGGRQPAGRRGGSGNSWSTIRWWRNPTASRWIRSATRAWTARARAAGSPVARTPVSPSRTTSSQPGALTATAGSPHAAASASTSPCVSVSEANRNTSAAW